MYWTAVRHNEAIFQGQIGALMTQIVDWGPDMWKVLHTCAEHAGSSILHLDEARAWMKLLKITEGALPCATCRTHYKEWLKANPVDEFLGLRGERLQGAIRLWLWRLHESVNARKQEPVHFPYEEVGIYKEVSPAELTRTLDKLKKTFDTAVLYRQVNITAVKEWRLAISLLRKLNSF